MTSENPESLPPEAELALAWSGPKVRAPLSTALQLDRRLARIVSRTTEPMLGQMRLAWWREALNRPLADRPRGDAVLDAIGRDWAGREAAPLFWQPRLEPDQYCPGRQEMPLAFARVEPPAHPRGHFQCGPPSPVENFTGQPTSKR